MKMKEFSPQDCEFMQMAIDLSVENVANGGGPFGAVIVRNGEVVATGTNRVTANNDPTAHAEVSAIRSACAKEKTFKLTGCTCYTSCEPCPMCLSALYWAGVERIVYGNTKDGQEEFFKCDVKPVISPEFTAEDLYVTYIDTYSYQDSLEADGDAFSLLLQPCAFTGVPA